MATGEEAGPAGVVMMTASSITTSRCGTWTVTGVEDSPGCPAVIGAAVRPMP